MILESQYEELIKLILGKEWAEDKNKKAGPLAVTNGPNKDTQTNEIRTSNQSVQVSDSDLL
jgi:hypothetical protein